MSRARAQLSTASAASEIRNVLTSTDLLFASALRVDGTLELVEYVSHSLSDVQSSILPARVHTTVLFNKTDARTDYPSLVSRNNHAAGQSVRPSSVRSTSTTTISQSVVSQSVTASQISDSSQCWLWGPSNMLLAAGGSLDRCSTPLKYLAQQLSDERCSGSTGKYRAHCCRIASRGMGDAFLCQTWPPSLQQQQVEESNCLAGQSVNLGDCVQDFF